jgi:hypothetical protein
MDLGVFRSTAVQVVSLPALTTAPDLVFTLEDPVRPPVRSSEPVDDHHLGLSDSLS